MNNGLYYTKCNIFKIFKYNMKNSILFEFTMLEELSIITIILNNFNEHVQTEFVNIDKLIIHHDTFNIFFTISVIKYLFHITYMYL